MAINESVTSAFRGTRAFVSKNGFRLAPQCWALGNNDWKCYATEPYSISNSGVESTGSACHDWQSYIINPGNDIGTSMPRSELAFKIWGCARAIGCSSRSMEVISTLSAISATGDPGRDPRVVAKHSNSCGEANHVFLRASFRIREVIKETVCSKGKAWSWISRSSASTERPSWDNRLRKTGGNCEPVPKIAHGADSEKHFAHQETLLRWTAHREKKTSRSLGLGLFTWIHRQWWGYFGFTGNPTWSWRFVWKWLVHRPAVGNFGAPPEQKKRLPVMTRCSKPTQSTDGSNIHTPNFR